VRQMLVVLLLTAATTAGAQGSAPKPAPIPSPAPPPQVSAFPGQYAPSPSDWRFPVWPSGCDRFQADERQACLEFVAFDFGRLSRYAGANALLAPPKAGEARTVFLGDSITDDWSAPQNGGFFPGKPYVNRGISGQTTAQMLVRFRQDVIALQPAAVVILAGTNDISANSGPVELETIEANLATMSELAKVHGIKVVLASLLPVTDEKMDREGRPLVQTRSRPPEKIQALNVWLADYARQNGLVYLDYFSAVADAVGRLRSDLTEDGLHPNAAGYALMAPLAEKAVAQALAGGR
jgi:lysophospholipase L1-like esterase